MLGYARSRHAATLAAAIALGVGVALIATSGGAGPRAKAVRAAATRTTTSAGAQFPDTPAGAVAAATAWCQDTAYAYIRGKWNSAVEALATPSLAARAQLVQPASSLVHRRLAASHEPYATGLWPLAYAVDRYSSAAARVRVWALAATDSPLFQVPAMYQITTVSLAWTGGDWKATNVVPGRYLTPPGPSASARQVTSWITTVNQLSDYTYAP
jgi:hypothetical protein